MLGPAEKILHGSKYHIVHLGRPWIRGSEMDALKIGTFMCIKTMQRETEIRAKFASELKAIVDMAKGYMAQNAG